MEAKQQTLLHIKNGVTIPCPSTKLTVKGCLYFFSVWLDLQA